LLYMVGFLRPHATTSGWTTFPTVKFNCEIQDGVQDGRHILKSLYYHRLLLYFHVQCIVSMGHQCSKNFMLPLGLSSTCSHGARLCYSCTADTALDTGASTYCI